MRGWESVRRWGIACGFYVLFTSLILCSTSYASDLSEKPDVKGMYIHSEMLYNEVKLKTHRIQVWPGKALQPIEAMCPAEALQPIGAMRPAEALQPIEALRPAEALHPSDSTHPTKTIASPRYTSSPQSSSLVHPAQMPPPAQPPKDIHIVWDTSGSMVAPADKSKRLVPTDVWAKAYYALEAFTAIVEAEDSISIYPMSMDLDEKPVEPPFRIMGQSGQDRVDKVMKALSNLPITLHTYFRTVERASQRDWMEGYQRWLVIITDGVFTRSYGREGIGDSGFYPRKEEGLLETLKDMLNEDPTLHIIYLNIGKEGQRNQVIPDDAGGGRLHWLSQKSGMNVTEMMLEVSQILSDLDRAAFHVQGDTREVKVTLPFPAKRLVMFVQSGSGDLKEASANGDLSVSGNRSGNTALDKGTGNDAAAFPDIDGKQYGWNSDITVFESPRKSDGPDIVTYARNHFSANKANLNLTKEDLKTINSSGAVSIFSPEDGKRNIASGEYSFPYKDGYVYSFFYVPDVAVTVELRQNDATFSQSVLDPQNVLASANPANTIKTGTYDLEIVLKDPETGEPLTGSEGNFADQDFSITITDQNGTRSYYQRMVTETLAPGEVTIEGQCPLGGSGQEKWEVKIPVRVVCEDGQTIVLEDMEEETVLPKIFLIPMEEGYEAALEDFKCQLTWGNDAEKWGDAAENAAENTAENAAENTAGNIAVELEKALTWKIIPTNAADGWFFYPASSKENLRRVANGSYRLQLTVDTDNRVFWIENPSQEITVSFMHKPRTLSVGLEQSEQISAWELYWRGVFSRGEISTSACKAFELTYLLGADPLSDESDREWLTASAKEHDLEGFLDIVEERPFQLLLKPGRQWWKYRGDSLRLEVRAEYDSGGTKSRTSTGGYVECRVEPLTNGQRGMILGFWVLLALAILLVMVKFFAWIFGVLIFKIWIPPSLCVYRCISGRRERCRRKAGLRERLLFSRKATFYTFGKRPKVGKEADWEFPNITLKRLRRGKYQIVNYEEFEGEQYKLNGDPITELHCVMVDGSVLRACDRDNGGHCDWSKESAVWSFQLEMRKIRIKGRK